MQTDNTFGVQRLSEIKTAVGLCKLVTKRPY
jgi:hypothetical protein